MEEEELTSSTKATNSTYAAVDPQPFMEHLIPSHNIALLLICGFSLFIGLYLAVNKFWHLQVAQQHFKVKMLTSHIRHVRGHVQMTSVVREGGG